MSDMVTTMYVLRLNQMFDDAISNYESERLAHEETSKKLANAKEAFDIIYEELKEARKRLEELEDAITHYIYGTYVNTSDIKDAINQAIQNSRERQEENRLRTKVAKFIDKNGGEAMG